MPQPMQNPKDISDPTTTLDMALKLTSKVFQLNNTTSTNNNQRSSSSPCYSQIAQSVMDQDGQMLMADDNVGNQFRENAVQNVGHLHRNGNVVAARAEGNSNGINGNLIRFSRCIANNSSKLAFLSAYSGRLSILVYYPGTILVEGEFLTNLASTWIAEHFLLVSHVSAHVDPNCLLKHKFNLLLQSPDIPLVLPSCHFLNYSVNIFKLLCGHGRWAVPLDKGFFEKIPVDVVFDGAFGGVGDEEVVVGEGVVVTSSSLKMLTNSYLGGTMVSLIRLEGLEEEALVEFMIELCEEDEDGRKNEKDGLFNLKVNYQSRKA
ncbi:hypothetical protein Tco_0566333 [Tanacetum coccineum]